MHSGVATAAALDTLGRAGAVAIIVQAAAMVVIAMPTMLCVEIDVRNVATTMGATRCHTVAGHTDTRVHLEAPDVGPHT